MKKQNTDLTDAVLKEAERVLIHAYSPRIVRCLELLSQEEIWWRPNPASNSVGNMVLHLQGNIRQWIISGLGRQPDRRDREREFAETRPIPRRTLLNGLRSAIKEAREVLTNLRQPDLAQTYTIQGFRVTGLQAVCHVTEHFAFHAGQIIYVTKLKRGKDLKFTRLPATTEKSKKRNRRQKAKDLPVRISAD